MSIERYFLGCPIWGNKAWVGELFAPDVVQKAVFLTLPCRKKLTFENFRFIHTYLKKYSPVSKGEALWMRASGISGI